MHARPSRAVRCPAPRQVGQSEDKLLPGGEQRHRARLPLGCCSAGDSARQTRRHHHSCSRKPPARSHGQYRSALPPPAETAAAEWDGARASLLLSDPVQGPRVQRRNRNAMAPPLPARLERRTIDPRLLNGSEAVWYQHPRSGILVGVTVIDLTEMVGGMEGRSLISGPNAEVEDDVGTELQEATPPLLLYLERGPSDLLERHPARRSRRLERILIGTLRLFKRSYRVFRAVGSPLAGPYDRPSSRLVMVRIACRTAMRTPR
jgi:hypothetical protein